MGELTIDHRQEAITKSADHQRNQTNRKEDQRQLPVTHRQVRVVHGHCGRDQGRKAEVDRERNRPVTNEPNPSRDETQHRLISFCDLERPV